MEPAPLVVTAELDAAARAVLDELRRRHFPPGRNHLAAHLTLFHAVPGEHRERVARELAAAARRAPVPLAVTGPRLLGRGVAVRFDGPPLLMLRAELARCWWPWLTRQDRQKNDLHVTVQNKVAPATARELHDRLAAGGLPAAATATGLALWAYRGGPWEPLDRWAFTGDQPVRA